MSVATKQSQPLRRIWRVPTSRARWYWLGSSVALFAAIFVWYLYAVKTQQFVGPINDPLRLFGIVAFALVLSTAIYTLRRRFVRGLPGKVQDWLWMHTWVGIAAILVALLHENFMGLLHDYCQNPGCLTDADWGMSALFALIFLVVSGVTGRLLDLWQTHVIARDASTNEVGIVSALEERILELEYTVERLCAGKTEAFKQFCLQALSAQKDFDVQGMRPEQLPKIEQKELVDFQRAFQTLVKRARLVQSLHRQQRARSLMRIWRSVHMVLASLGLLIIAYHAISELLTNVLHILPGG